MMFDEPPGPGDVRSLRTRTVVPSAALCAQPLEKHGGARWGRRLLNHEDRSVSSAGKVLRGEATTVIDLGVDISGGYSVIAALTPPQRNQRNLRRHRKPHRRTGRAQAGVHVHRGFSRIIEAAGALAG